MAREFNLTNEKMFKNLTLASFLACSAVILGAFGAHALKEILDAEQLSSFETGVRYQMYHALIIFFVNNILFTPC